jgi:hypothetical protein
VNLKYSFGLCLAALLVGAVYRNTVGGFGGLICLIASKTRWCSIVFEKFVLKPV